LGAIAYNDPFGHYRLKASIDLAGIRWSTAVIPWFGGTFDGNGLTISHLTIESGDNTGLFGELALGAEVEDLGLLDVNMVALEGAFVGALVGASAGDVTHCYSTGIVNGLTRVGGLIGRNSGAVTGCYSTVTITGHHQVGGLIGRHQEGDVTRCYSTGLVDGSWHVGGLVGLNYNGIVSESFWDIQTSGQSSTSSGTSKTTAEMQTASTFLSAGWDLVDETENGREDIWYVFEGQDYPRLWWQLPIEYVVLVIDDFESYSNEVGERVFETWIDGAVVATAHRVCRACHRRL